MTSSLIMAMWQSVILGPLMTLLSSVILSTLLQVILYIYIYRGDWFTPGGRVVNSDSVPGFRRHESPIAVRLFKSTATDPTPEGIYQCVVKFDVLAEQTVHVGLYHSGGNYYLL